MNMDQALDVLESWKPGLIALGWKLVVVILILLVGKKLISYLQVGMEKTFTKMQMDISLSKFLISVLTAGGYAFVLFMAAEQLGIPSTSILALLGSATLAVGLALQGSLANFAGGILLLIMRPFAVGDYISDGVVEGTVENIGIVYTTLVTVDNKKITVPNGTLSNSTVTNVTVQEKRRVDISVGISYTSDIKKAKSIMERIYQNHHLVLKEEMIVVFVSELADSAVVLGARGWANTADYFSVKWDITERIKLEFDEAGVEIPFNQMDINIKNNN